jgi:hypothetical protein
MEKSVMKQISMILEVFDSDAGLPDVTRRHLLQRAAIGAGVALAVFGMASQAVAKMTQKASGYQATPKGDQNCANCSLFTAPSSCTLVEGTIGADAWCRYYAKKS